MERGFQALLLGGESSDDDYSPPAFTGTTSGDACISALYSSAMNAQKSKSFLSDEKYLLQSLEYGYGAVPAAPSVDPVACGYESYDVVGDWKLKSVGYADEKLKVPTYETVDYESVSDVTEPPFDFLSKSSGSVSREFDSRFSQLPGMNSQTSSFLSLSDEMYLLQSLEKYGYGTLPVAYGYDVVEDSKLKYVDYADDKLKMPKYETVDYESVSDVVSAEPQFDFISKSSGSVSREFDSRFSQLPAIKAQTSSFLSISDENYLLQSLECGYGALPVAPSVDKSVEYVDVKLKVPKYEPVDYESFGELVSTEPPFDFISKTSGSNSGVFDSRFGKLPSLLSLEPVHDSFGLTESPKKRVRSLSPATSNNSYFTGSIPQEIELMKARKRRQTISEKTSCLQKLLPWDKKMDRATMLEEAYKYVKFLQAQVSVLQSMPVDSSFSTRNPAGNGAVNVFGGLGRLNRQQLLQVMVNSPGVQTTLYSKGLCVYSVEQLVTMKKVAERKALYQQLGWNPSLIS
ncbi:hypothetical protein RHGRI_010008 [Rhododendron griersonianum]|uniref:BHLH domain-containing protein n=1 Tax=Rhododendron griersonianum TaxID=479676 RepID=A0AAV6KHM2_9ERIC|nr:hypothetical protein RHGRI_010008 [Rhododendron griersonianum]